MRERESKSPLDKGGRGILKIILISLLASLACAGIIKAATTVGNNITTNGTLDVSGNSVFTTASSTGIVKFGQINSDTGSINFGDENLYTTGNIGIGTSSPYAKLSVVGEIVGSYFTATSTTATSTFTKLAVDGMLGAERVGNGTFDAAGTWVAGTGWTLNVKASGGTAGTTLSQDIGAEANKTYKVVYTITQTSSSNTYLTVSVGSQMGTPRNASGTYTEYLTGVNPTGNVAISPTVSFFDAQNNTWSGTVNSVSVKEVTSGALTIDGTTTFRSPILGKVPLLGSMRITNTSDILGVFNNMGIMELYGSSPAISTGYNNVLYSEQNLTAAGTATNATNSYNQTKLGSRGTATYGSIDQMLSSLSFKSVGGTYNITALSNLNVDVGEAGISTGTYNIANLYNLRIGGSAAGLGTFNVTDKWADINIGSMSDFSSGTVATKAGIWIEPQTIGTANYGIVLNGDGAGSDIVFGAGQDKNIYFDGNNMQYGGMQLNDIGTQDVCSVWASIVNPYMCIGLLDHSVTTETAMIASSTVFATGPQFTYTGGVTQADILPKGNVWTFNSASGKYLSYTDSGSTFSFTNGVVDSPFSIVAWAQVVDQGGTHVVFAKYGTVSAREYVFQEIAGKFYFSLVDQSAGATCSNSTAVATSFNTWHMMVVTYDGSSLATGIDFYDQGVAAAAADSQNCVSDGYVAMEDTTRNVTIGAQANPSNYYLGDMGHIEVVSGALTADQILKMYNSSKAKYGL